MRFDQAKSADLDSDLGSDQTPTPEEPYHLPQKSVPSASAPPAYSSVTHIGGQSARSVVRRRADDPFLLPCPRRHFHLR